MATTTDRDRRLALLLTAESESARFCAQDAAAALNRAEYGPWGNGYSAVDWFTAADMWLARGASHEWGFALPEGW